MVMLHMKKSEDHQYLFETLTDEMVEDTITSLVQVSNLRNRLVRMKLEGEELAIYGPAKMPDKQGIDEYSEEPIQKNEFYKQDPTGRRTGNACDPQAQTTLLKTLDEGSQLVNKTQVQRKVALTARMLHEAVDNIRGAVMICYPMGLPEYDIVRASLEDKEDLSGTSYALDDFDVENTTLWFAGKQMQAGEKLSKYIGRNEKQKIVVRLQKKGDGPPQREPVVDEQTHKGMLAHYYKKQEEQKKLNENDDDSYYRSDWANPKGLKQSISGLNNIRIR